MTESSLKTQLERDLITHLSKVIQACHLVSEKDRLAYWINVR